MSAGTYVITDPGAIDRPVVLTRIMTPEDIRRAKRARDKARARRRYRQSHRRRS